MKYCFDLNFLAVTVLPLRMNCMKTLVVLLRCFMRKKGFGDLN